MSDNTWLGRAIQALLPEPDPEDVENIDFGATFLIERNKNHFYDYQKRYPILAAGRNRSLKDYMPDVHIKLKFGNDAEKNDLWKAIIFEVDNDFPWNPMRKLGELAEYCTKCQGYLWKNTILEPGDLKKAARQVGMTKKGPDDIRIQNFVAHHKCSGTIEKRIV